MSAVNVSVLLWGLWFRICSDTKWQSGDKTLMESLKAIKETTGVSPLVFAPISTNLYLQAFAFQCLQNMLGLFQILLNFMPADTLLNKTMRLLNQGRLIGNQHISAFFPCISISFIYHVAPDSDAHIQDADLLLFALYFTTLFAESKIACFLLQCHQFWKIIDSTLKMGLPRILSSALE